MVEMKETVPDLGKRRFLVACIALSGLAGTPLGPVVFRAGRAWAQAESALDSDARDAVVRMARLLYPHDAVADNVYGEVLDQVLASTASDPALLDHIAQAHAALDVDQQAAFIDLDEEAQVAAMQAVEDMDFFRAIQGAVRSRLYRHSRVWEHLGYDGPSFAQGGFLNRGAGDIDWLEDAG